MNPAFDPTSVRKTLKHGIKKGLWTLEDLDKPSQGYLLANGQKWNEENQSVEWDDYITPIGHQRSVPKEKTPTHRNLLREPEPIIEAVEASPDPRDLDPGSVSNVSGARTQILGQEEEPIYSTVGVIDSDGGINEPLPF